MFEINFSKIEDLLKVKGMVFNIQRYSLHDGPGIRTIVFFKGCPLRCPWCSNPESQSFKKQLLLEKKNCIRCGMCAELSINGAITIGKDGYPFINKALYEQDSCKKSVLACPTGALYYEGEKMTVEQVIKEVEKDLPFYRDGGGMTLSGGEMLSQPEFAIALLRVAQSRGIHTVIETTGFAPARTFRNIVRHVDLVLFDFKHYDSNIHEQVIGCKRDQIIDNLRYMIDKDIPHIVRIPVIPDFNYSDEVMSRMTDLLIELGEKKVQLLPFHQYGERKYELLGMEYTYSNVPSLKNDDLEPIKKMMSDKGLDVEIIG
ncbi:MAG: glycyl-radical enzyme activating protein [Saccharofermentanales bacterium]|jgi:pyruvate formate lyase activating enzyme